MEEAREALRLQPDNEENYANLSDCYLSLDRLDEAEAVLKQAADRKLESEDLLSSRYVLAFLKGDTGEMERLAATAASKPLIEDFWRHQAFMEARQGRLRNARELLTRPGFICPHCLGLIEAPFGDTQRARTDAAAAVEVE